MDLLRRHAAANLLDNLLEHLDASRGEAIAALRDVRAVDDAVFSLEAAVVAMAGSAPAAARSTSASDAGSLLFADALEIMRDARAAAFGSLDYTYEAVDAVVKNCDRRLRLLEGIVLAQDRYMADMAQSVSVAESPMLQHRGRGGSARAAVASTASAKRARPRAAVAAHAELSDDGDDDVDVDESAAILSAGSGRASGSSRCGGGGRASGSARSHAAGMSISARDAKRSRQSDSRPPPVSRAAASLADEWSALAAVAHRRVSDVLAGVARSAASAAGDMLGADTFDASEPLYCTCRQVAFGEMIACDNAGCRTEWFHTMCVGVSRSSTPRKWMCADCTAAAAASYSAGAATLSAGTGAAVESGTVVTSARGAPSQSPLAAASKPAAAALPAAEATALLSAQSLPTRSRTSPR